MDNDYQSVCFKIPNNNSFPVEMSNFTPDEILLVFVIGTNAVLSVKNQLILKENSEHIERIKCDLNQKYKEIFEKKDETISSLQIQQKTEKDIFDKFIEQERGKIEKDAFYQYNIIIDKEKEELEKTKEELINKRIEIEKIKCDIENRVREEVMKMKLDEQNYKNEIEKLKVEIQNKVREQQDIAREEIMEIKLNVEKCKNEIEVKNLIQLSLNEEKTRKEIEDLNKIHYEELEGLKIVLREIENEKIRIEEINNTNEKTTQMKIEQSLFSKMKIEIEKRDLIVKENNDLKDQLNIIKNEIFSKELSIEKLTNEMLVKQIDENKRSNVPANIGNEGEQIFFNLANETFDEFDDFKIENVSKSGGHQGDFIMSFQKFQIMVDVKKYTRSVGSCEREKLKQDLENSPHIKVAWLVSLQTKVGKFGKHPFMCEIINNSCIFYVNSLLLTNNPSETLKLLWCSTETLFDVILNKDNENIELDKKRKNEIRIHKICQDMMRQSKDSKMALNQVKTIHEKMETSIQEILKEGINELRENANDVISLWCQENIVSSMDKKLNLVFIYEIFKRDHPQFNISLDSFRLSIKNIYGIKSKTFKSMSGLDFIGKIDSCIGNNG
jgi:hypothetical protein